MFDHIMACFFQDGAGRSKSNFFHDLYLLNIWPISTRLNIINLDFIRRGAIADYDEQDNILATERLISMITRAIDAQKGLCLNCVRKGKISSHQGNCHARLRYLCTG